MNIEDLKKRRSLIENNLKRTREQLTNITQNVFRMEGALIDVDELIKIEEDKLKEEKKKLEEVNKELKKEFKKPEKKKGNGDKNGK